MKTTTLLLVSFSFLLMATAARAGDPVTKCQSSKLKAWATLRWCEHEASAKELTGGTSNPTDCQAAFDADIAKAGTGCRYLDNGDRTVTDLDTGLMWQKTDDDGGLTDKDNDYTWSGSGFDHMGADGSAFTVFLAGLNDCRTDDGTTVVGGFAGHCDWRLPQIDELISLFLAPYPCALNPCIDQVAFGPTNPATNYWAATTVGGRPDKACNVDLDGAHWGDDTKIGGAKVRAVRSGL